MDQRRPHFSVVQRKALTPNDFTSLDQIRERLAAFEIRYNAIAAVHLDVHLHRPQQPPRRIDAHDKTQPRDLASTTPPTNYGRGHKPGPRQPSTGQDNARYVRLVRFSFLILIGRFVTLEP